MYFNQKPKLRKSINNLIIQIVQKDMISLWDIALCSLEVDRRFRGAYCLHYQGDKTSSTSRLHFDISQKAITYSSS